MFHTQQHKVKRFVFLDFEGVVCTQRHRLEMVGMGQPWKDEFGPFFDPNAVENLKDIVDSTGANIIVTSTWKYKGLAAMQTLWNIRRMPGVLMDITPTLPAAFMFTRGMEINKWLYSNTPDNPEEFRYIIIDDGVDFLPEQSPYLVKIDPSVGLTVTDAEKAKAMLL